MSTTFANMAVAGIIVFSTVSAGRMAYLCALRWQHVWRLFASLPLMALAGWLVLTALQYRKFTGLPSLWSVELYAWAMASAVYLGGLLCAKAFLARTSAGTSAGTSDEPC